jgi:hypothetical protein
MLTPKTLSVCDLPAEREANVSVVPPAQWPTSGEILVRDLCVRYHDHMPDVLQHIDLDIKVSPVDAPLLRFLIIYIPRAGKESLFAVRRGQGKARLPLPYFGLSKAIRVAYPLMELVSTDSRYGTASVAPNAFDRNQTSNRSPCMIYARA